jgi:serine/threonine protein kinase
VYDFGTIEHLTYLAMQYVSGGTLHDQLRSGRPLEPQRAAIYALQMARALYHAHCHNIIHRDVKPANMLISSSHPNELLLSDFGIARLFERPQEMPIALAPERSTSMLTRGAGSPPYMAPEQIRQQPVDARADVYALGVVLYEMLTGQRPFQADNILGLQYQHVFTPPKPVREVNPAVPEVLEQITLRALAKAPEQRYQSADEMAQALSAILVPPQPPRVKIVSTPQPRPKNTVKWIAILLVIILVIVQILIKLGVLQWLGTVFH